MQFRLITAILASAAVSGVAAGPVYARQDPPSGDASLDTSMAATSEGGGSGTGTGGADKSLDVAQATVQDAGAAAPAPNPAPAPGGNPDPTGSQWQIPGFGNINLHFDNTNPWNINPVVPVTPVVPAHCTGLGFDSTPGCDGTGNSGGFLVPFSSQWCAYYNNPPGCPGYQPPMPKPQLQCPNDYLRCNSSACPNAYYWPFDGYNYCGSNPSYGSIPCRCSF